MSMKTLTVNHLPSVTWNKLHVNDVTVSAELDSNVLLSAPFTCLPEGASICTLSFEEAEDYLEKNAKEEKAERFIAGKTPVYHTQRFGTGLGAEFDALLKDSRTPVELLTIEEGTGEAPIRLSIELGDGDRAHAAQLIHLKRGAKATVILDERTESDAAGALCVSTKLLLEEGAQLTLIRVQLLGGGFIFLDDVGGQLQAMASCEMIQMILGGQESYAGTGIELMGREASFEASSGYLATGSQFVDLNYNVIQRAKKTNCEMSFDGVLRDDARKTFRGTIDFRNGAAGSRGNEQENVLLLGDGVVNKTMPVILCEEEDVEGSHGATIGRLDEQILFYMATRGISEQEAEKMMVRARLGAVARRIPDEALQSEVMDYVDARIQCDSCLRAPECPKLQN